MNLEMVLQELNIPYRQAGEHRHSHSGWLNINCPYCESQDSDGFHLGLSITGFATNCWKCGTHNRVKALQEAANVPYNRVKALLGEVEYQPTVERLPGGKLVLPKNILPDFLPIHEKYLKKRGFDPEEISRLWKVQSMGLKGARDRKYWWRLFIPIFYHGEMVSFTTRSVSPDAKMRYISCELKHEKISHKTLLYGEDLARNSIAIVEGCPDVWSIGPGAVATFGIDFTEAQVLKMSKYPVRVVCFDNEPEAQKQAKKLCDDLSLYPGETYRVVLDAKDPGAAQKSEIREFRKRFLD